MVEDTIVAVSTPPGEGGIGIVRISGPSAVAIGRKIFTGKQNVLQPQSHHLYLGQVRDPQNGRLVDEVLISFMKAPHTYTKEDVVEINCHGGILPVAKTLQLVLAQGARLATAGEFTQRAFLNGRLDLAQAEAVIQIIRAKTETALQLGMDQLHGLLSSEVREIRSAMLKLLAHVEVSIDFPEHHDVEELTRAELQQQIKLACGKIEQLLSTADKGRILREGLKTAIIGQPNVGKSSLLNALLRQQRAIVTAVPGTTRDVLEESVNLGGVALTIIDTAGIRATEDEVERIGVERSRYAMEAADLVLLMVDLSQPFSQEEREILRDIKDKPCIIVANKTDLVDEKISFLYQLTQQVLPLDVVAMSLQNKQGLDDLEQAIVDKVFAGAIPATEAAMITSTRHKEALKRAQSALLDLRNAIHVGYPIDLLAIDLHAVLEALGEITGETVGADLVDEIFSSFCIGK